MKLGSIPGAWLALSLSLLLSSSRVAAATTGTPYPLIRGSTYTAGGRAPLVPLRGRLVLTPVLSPLDWDNYAVDLVRIETGDGPPTVWRGTGFYSLGGRGIPRQQLRLDLSDGSTTVRFDSGSVPADGTWPELDLLLTNDTPPGPQLRIMAVPELARWRYRSLAGTTFLDDCEICDRPPIPVRVEGGFDLVLTATNPLFDRYHLFDVRLTDGSEKPAYVLAGEGAFEIGGEVAVIQKWSLDLDVRTPADFRTVTLRNETATPDRERPVVHAVVAEEGGTPVSRYFLDLPAAPWHALWFTTQHGLTSGLGEWPTNRITGADLLEDSGRVVRSGASLLKAAGLPPDLGIDALDVLPGSGGVVLFSIAADAKSDTLGTVSEGDVLASDGRVWRRNKDLLQAFGFMPPVPDLGLDAVSVDPAGRVLFSVRQAAFSERLGRLIGPGDLLADDGTVVRTQADLLARFKPLPGEPEPELDGFHVWPSGEVWFSTTHGFQEAGLGSVMDGDLLSDRGYVVARNLDLVRPFQPLEDLANFGLEGFLLVNDATALPGGATLTISRPAVGELLLNWTGPGRVFRVEGAAGAGEPWTTRTPILADPAWRLPWSDGAGGLEFSRVRSW